MTNINCTILIYKYYHCIIYRLIKKLFIIIYTLCFFLREVGFFQSFVPYNSFSFYNSIFCDNIYDILKFGNVLFDLNLQIRFYSVHSKYIDNDSESNFSHQIKKIQ